MSGAVRWRDFAAALAVLALAVAFLVWAQAYPARTRTVPVLVAWVAIALAAIDAVCQTETRIGRFIRRFVVAQSIIEWKPQGAAEAGSGRAALAILWVAGFTAAIVAFGVLIAIPLYVAAYMVWHGGKSVRAACVTALATTAAIWLAFEILLRYPLYPGLLFGGD